MPSELKPGTAALRVAVFAVLAFALLQVLSIVFWFLFAPRLIVASTLSVFLAAAAANALAMRIYEQAPLTYAGFPWNAASVRNLLLGFAGGIGAALLVTLGPVLEGAAELARMPQQQAGFAGMLFLLVMLLFGGIGEEMLFHGYGFQRLMGVLGPFATILPVSVLFALAHSRNLNVTTLAMVNTGLWGVLLGFAFWRSGDLWLPIGLHVGWNWMLPLFGTNLSGFTMNVTGYEMRWRTSPLWSGGEYGPEGGLLTTAALAVLFLWLVWKAPLQRQTPFLLRDSWED